MTSRTLLLTAGRFGAALSRCWQRERDGVTIMLLERFEDAREAMGSPPTFIGVAAWRRYTAELEAVDRWCWDAAVPWTTIVLEGPVLRAGPLVVPGRSACHACYRARWLSNSPVADRELALDAACAMDPRLGPHGFTVSLARIGAALLASDERDAARAAGRTRWFDFRGGGLTEETLVRVHGCARCAPQRAPRARYTRLLRPALADLERRRP